MKKLEPTLIMSFWLLFKTELFPIENTFFRQLTEYFLDLVNWSLAVNFVVSRAYIYRSIGLFFFANHWKKRTFIEKYPHYKKFGTFFDKCNFPDFFSTFPISIDITRKIRETKASQKIGNLEFTNFFTSIKWKLVKKIRHFLFPHFSSHFSKYILTCFRFTNFFKTLWKRNFGENHTLKMWILWKNRYQKCEFCWKNHFLKLWILWKNRYQKCEFCWKSHFENVIFVKNHTLKM